MKKLIIITILLLSASYDIIAQNLNDTTVLMKEVVVKAANTYRKGNKLIIHVPTDNNKNSEELLKQAPGVWLNDKDISINGASGTKVYIEGREVKLNGEALIAYLHSINSSDIRRIEIQSISDASQSADSKGGIIHIFLRKRINDGLQGNVQTEFRYASSLQDYRPSFSLTARKDHWNFYSSSSYNTQNKNNGVLESERSYLTSNSSFKSISYQSSPNYYGTFRFGSIYEIDSLRSIGAEIEYTRDSSNGKTENQSLLSDGSQRMESNGVYKQPEHYNLYSAATNYQQKLDNQGSALKIIADFIRKRSNNNNNYDIYHQWNYQDTIYRNKLSSIYDIASADASLKKFFKAQTYFQLGLKYTYTGMNDKGSYESLINNKTWNDLPLFGYKMRYSENIYAAYMMYTTEWKKWSINAGIRVEQTTTTNHTNHTNKNYTDFYPSLTANYSFDELHKWMMIWQFTRNVERPDFYSLNPNRIQTSEYTYQIGNILLKPDYINKISATLIFNYRYILSVGCNLHHNLIRQIGKQDSYNPQVSYITFENHNHENHWFVYMELPIQFTSWLRLNTDITAVRQCIQLNSESNYNNHNLLFVKGISNIRISSSLSAELEYNYHNRLYSGNSEVAPLLIINFLIKKKFNKENIIATTGIENIFNCGEKYRSTLDTYITNTRYDLASKGRIIKFAVAWNFNSGKQVKKHLLENSSSNERNRINKNILN